MNRFAFPITLETQQNGWILVSYPDVPEALTEGETKQEALEEAQDCLICALGGYIAKGWPIPVPSAAESDAIAELPEDVTLKLSLYTQMLQRNISPAMLAKRVGRTEAWVGQLLDLDELASPTQLGEAINALSEAARRQSSELKVKAEGLSRSA
ncbi:MAG: type II toxin-antitoxin system HicB family antitoxin [Gammaproteobacteria bacterium]|nr:type II toxin-antitoxin system HicB family antitoxin [Gammaproteobacteria bacterium]MXW45473.1 type II toxin-antitoxin system HicB family antitoxin [Gammaproteobacteria bacterium]MYD01768.1 type II toxin-antitoxin system HicB family antitoxin [Gammaproteobacteria bacterium]MYI25210.1 type II toxin-antitoxin system HicB family antitoxin [Gammaproteobacteria bacterium]